MNQVEAAWLAGLLEGEGTFGWAPRIDADPRYPIVRLAMSDEDVVRRAAALMGAGVVHRRGRGHHKDVWTASKWGWPALDVMRAVRPFMGTRRGARIDELVAGHSGSRRGARVASAA
jgi:hypothetical protein